MLLDGGKHMPRDVHIQAGNSGRRTCLWVSHRVRKGETRLHFRNLQLDGFPAPGLGQVLDTCRTEIFDKHEVA